MANQAANHNNGKVSIGFIHPGQVFGEFAMSLAWSTLSLGKKRINNIIQMQSSPRIAEGRTQVTQEFLRHGDEWLLMVDSDMVWEPEDLETLIRSAHPTERPIVGGLCFGGGRSEGIFPTIYEMKSDEKLDFILEKRETYPKNALLKVGATGAAFLLVHRSVFVKMYEQFQFMPDGSLNPYPWFAEVVYKGGRPLGEDITFCIRARMLNIPVFVHTGVKTKHIKLRALDEDMYLSQRKG